jgi:hypothetical protein
MGTFSFILGIFLLLASEAFGQKSQPPVAAYDINNIIFADGGRYTSVNACVAAVKNPGICLIPSNVANGSVWTAPPNHTAILDTRFTNDLGFLEGAIPYQHSHWYFDCHAGADDSYESNPGSGPICMSINAFADSGGISGQPSKANLVGLQIGSIQASTSIRPTWGQDTNVNCYNMATAQCIGAEFDFSNTGTVDDTTYHGIGISEISAGSAKPGIGMAITATNPPANEYEITAQFSNYHKEGVQISNGDAGSTGLLLSYLGAGSKAIIIEPPDDTTALEVQGYNSNATETPWYIDNKGDSNWLTITAESLVSSPAYSTSTNCSSAASPAACGSAAAGSVVVAASATTAVVDTKVVTANSQIILTFDSSLGTKLSVTCNVTFDQPYVSARTTGVGFTITVTSGPTTNPACYSYVIIN